MHVCLKMDASRADRYLSWSWWIRVKPLGEKYSFQAANQSREVIRFCQRVKTQAQKRFRPAKQRVKRNDSAPVRWFLNFLCLRSALLSVYRRTSCVLSPVVMDGAVCCLWPNDPPLQEFSSRSCASYVRLRSHSRRRRKKMRSGPLSASTAGRWCRRIEANLTATFDAWSTSGCGAGSFIVCGLKNDGQHINRVQA